MPYCVECGGEYEAGVDMCPDCNVSLVEVMPPANPDANPDATLVEVFSSAGDTEALIIRGLLESEGIICSLSSDVPHTVLPVEIDGLGAVRVCVSDADAERAAEIISSHQGQAEGE